MLVDEFFRAAGLQNLRLLEKKQLTQSPEFFAFRCVQDKMTLLHHLVACNRVAVIRPLIEMGADPNAKDIDGSTPIFVACATEERDVAIELARLGADPSIKDVYVRQKSSLSRPIVPNYHVEIIIFFDAHECFGACGAKCNVLVSFASLPNSFRFFQL